MKFQFIEAHKRQYRIALMCRALNVSRSGYYHWLKHKPGKWQRQNAELFKEIKTLFYAHRGVYGSPRITAALHQKGYACSRPRVARLMAQNGLSARAKQRFRATTDSRHQHEISPNILQQDFTATAPNQKWASDITYIRTAQGWLYLTVILDLYSRKVVGWAMSRGLSAQETTCPALTHAWRLRRPEKGLILHSDRGVQYACTRFRELVRSYKITQSMSAKGNCYDNAVCESFFRTLKTELVYRNHYKTIEQAKQSIFEYIEVFYNRQRMHYKLGLKTPTEFELQNKAA